MLTGRRFRVEFTAEQAVYAEQVGAVCRSVWNTGLEQRREYRRRGAWMNYEPQAKELAEAKADHPWLKDVPGHCLQQTLMDLDKACRKHGTFRVRWRSGRRWPPAFRFPEGNKMTVQKLNRWHARIKLPKLGWVKFRASRSLSTVVIRSATLTRQGRHWVLSVLIDDGRQQPQVHETPESAVGIDRGVATAIATSAGELIDRTFSTDGERQRVAALQRRLSRCKRQSANRNKIRAELAAVRERERYRRQDFCAQSAHLFTGANAVVVIEDLKTRNMTRSAKGTLHKPGRNVKAKSGLNRAILGKGWYQFALALSSAARYTGTTVVTVPAAYTSQRCSACGHVDPKSRESQAVFRCTHCPHHEHADVNAAKNILAAGLAVTACEDQPRPAGQTRSLKQEPAGNREGLLPQPAHTAPAA
ncbi:IS891/IS1136/IS1341 family transposase [Mycobacteroides abscessus subsp. abscessus]|uniref:RNA-guided endonuclease InsQ/TnpB family protein n=1 Tax=Mycobacteroides abscessus TaxID=36809 RepID=UPI0009279E24|nr:RNA-guided endonuclease TnpB family protein [Mycobacteroides abscessus]SHY08418.1 IS891/IS1136/IS1341 family transposase [Mycobacteroides abscessus subsp. abscessus]SIC76271.1 IS891/IS1136/IS1341 family transposase [Mycobacteroides abscessus subsp. abscessus]SKP28392.1 IS891/IS1136/IS1341 family transposase [Mycobacteroides abscessus subsp. abscessus]